MRHSNLDPAERARQRTGVFHGVLAYLWWGLIPIYFKILSHVPPIQVLCHRILWALAFSAALVTATRHWDAVFAAVRSRRTALTLFASSSLIALNWFVYIWAVTNSHIAEASLGYYINPLVNVLLGVVFLHERLRRAQVVSVVLAGIGVTFLAWRVGDFPWLSIVLAVSFGLYGLLRKVVKVESLAGLTIECSFLAPFAAAYVGYLALQGRSAMPSAGLATSAWLFLAGPITALPLIWFASAARRLRLATMGFLQYLAPSLQLTLGVVVYGEPFTHAHAAAFGFIWTALAIFSWDAWRSK